VKRLRRSICTFVAVAVVFAGLSQTPAKAAPPTFADAVAAGLSTREAGTAGALKEFALSLTPGNSTGDSILADTDSFYLADQNRPTSSIAVDTMRAHDMAYVGDLSTTKDAPATYVTAVLADLNANRRSAETLLQDLRVLSTYKAVGNSLDLGTKFLEQANDAWAKGNAKLAVEKFAEVQRRAFDGFGLAGVNFSVGADTDKDGAEDYLELLYQSNPFVGDTDGDGLGDAFEINFGGPYHRPNNRDSDGDGILDPAEDEDGDTLNSLAEQANRSDPLLPDSDSDSLADTLEIQTSLTKPFNADSDSDGVSDGVEYRNETNPNNPDSDGDGIRDDVDQVSVSVSGQGVRAVLTGTGDLSLGATIRSAPLPPAKGQLGTAVDIKAGPSGILSSAALTFNYDPATASAPVDLRVFTYDESIGSWLPIPGPVQLDPVARTVTVTTPHLSIYALFNIRIFLDALAAKTQVCTARSVSDGLDVALVLDSSGSMAWNDPQNIRLSSSKGFVDTLLPADRAAIVDFDDSVRVWQTLTSDKALLKAGIDRVDAYGGTNIGAGVETGLNQLTSSGTRTKVMVLLTDGDGSYSSTLTARANNEKVTIFTIGLGSGVNTALLNGIAAGTGGKYFSVADASGLTQAFKGIGNETSGDPGTDTDDDGLTDCEEINGITETTFEQKFVTQKPNTDSDGDGLNDGVNDPDSDGDGLDDGAEVFRTTVDLSALGGSPTTKWVAAISDPTLADSDDDAGRVNVGAGNGIPFLDFHELKQGSYPWYRGAPSGDSDGDGLDDPQEYYYGTDPQKRDTDGDGFTDGDEALVLPYVEGSRSSDFQPLAFDDPLTPKKWIKEYYQGALGDAVDIDSFPQMVGYIAFSIAGGPVADARDVIANLLRGQWAGAGLSAIGFIPVAGDKIKTSRVFVRFVEKFPGKADDVAAAIQRFNSISESTKAKLFSLIGRSSLFNTVKNAFGDLAAKRLVAGRKAAAAEMIAKRGTRIASGQTFLGNWRLGEDFLRKNICVARGWTCAKGAKGIADPALVKAGKKAPRNWRYGDAIDLAGKKMAESKVGFQDGPKILRQITKDTALKADGWQIEWHFFSSGASDSIGASKDILDALDAAGIPYFFHA
jgi:von Willebrand factor type A domain/Bacterial TSP3 repeat